MIERLEAGATVLSPDGSAFSVDEELAAAFEPGDRVVATRQAGLLRIPAAEARRADEAVTAASDAFGAMNAVGDEGHRCVLCASLEAAGGRCGLGCHCRGQR